MRDNGGRDTSGLDLLLTVCFDRAGITSEIQMPGDFYQERDLEVVEREVGGGRRRAADQRVNKTRVYHAAGAIDHR